MPWSFVQSRLWAWAYKSILQRSSYVNNRGGHVKKNVHYPVSDMHLFYRNVQKFNSTFSISYTFVVNPSQCHSYKFQNSITYNQLTLFKWNLIHLLRTLPKAYTPYFSTNRANMKNYAWYSNSNFLTWMLWYNIWSLKL